MPVAKEINLAKNHILTNFHAFPTGFAVAGVYVDEPGEGIVSENHILLFFYAKVA